MGTRVKYFRHNWAALDANTYWHHKSQNALRLSTSLANPWCCGADVIKECNFFPLAHIITVFFLFLITLETNSTIKTTMIFFKNYSVPLFWIVYEDSKSCYGHISVWTMYYLMRTCSVSVSLRTHLSVTPSKDLFFVRAASSGRIHYCSPAERTTSRQIFTVWKTDVKLRWNHIYFKTSLQ